MATKRTWKGWAWYVSERDFKESLGNALFYDTEEEARTGDQADHHVVVPVIITPAPKPRRKKK